VVLQFDFLVASVVAKMSATDQSLSVMPFAGLVHDHSEKSEAFRLPLAKKVSNPSTVLRTRFDGPRSSIP
jgi:hypothetical protein